MFSLSEKIIIVTGGNGNLGKEFSKSLLNHGARVVSIDITSHSSLPHSSDYLYIKADVTQRGEMEMVLDEIQHIWNDAPYGLINNAALDSPPDANFAENGPFENYPESSWDKVMTVNTKGTFLPCQVFGHAMANAGRGSIINISSIYGLVSPDQRIYEYRAKDGNIFNKPVAYSVSKSAILNFTRYLATYWGSKNIRVNTLTFGGVFGNQDENFLKGYTTRVPLGRMAKSDEYNGVVIFLLSQAASYITGANIVVDGGWTAW